MSHILYCAVNFSCIAVGFLVPRAYINPNASNSIGMTFEAWQSCFQCFSNSSCTSVVSRNESDQFDAFRSQTLADSVAAQIGGQCTFLPGESRSHVSRFSSFQTISCTNAAAASTLEIFLDLNVLNVTILLEPHFTAELKNTGLLPWSAGSTSGTVYADITNIGDMALECQMLAGSCCLHHTPSIVSCESGATASNSKKETIAANMTMRFFSVVSLSHSQSTYGTCDFTLAVDGQSNVYVSIPFTTADFFQPPPMATPEILPPPSPDQFQLPAAVLFSLKFVRLSIEKFRDSNFFAVFTSRCVSVCQFWPFWPLRDLNWITCCAATKNELQLFPGSRWRM